MQDKIKAAIDQFADTRQLPFYGDDWRKYLCECAERLNGNGVMALRSEVGTLDGMMMVQGGEIKVVEA